MMNENEINRLRDLQLRASELGVAIAMDEQTDLDEVARILSKMIDEAGI